MRILTAPYEERDSWEMNAMLVDGTLYLEEHVSDAKLLEKCVMIRGPINLCLKIL